MQIVITGRHLGVTDAMKAYAREKAGKLGKTHERLTKIEVTMDVAPKGGHVVEMVVDANRARLVGKAEHADMYAAVDLAEDKLLRQLIKHKERLSNHHRGEPSISGLALNSTGSLGDGIEGGARPPAGEESFDDAVDRLRDEEPRR